MEKLFYSVYTVMNISGLLAIIWTAFLLKRTFTFRRFYYLIPLFVLWFSIEYLPLAQEYGGLIDARLTKVKLLVGTVAAIFALLVGNWSSSKVSFYTFEIENEVATQKILAVFMMLFSCYMMYATPIISNAHFWWEFLGVSVIGWAGGVVIEDKFRSYKNFIVTLGTKKKLDRTERKLVLGLSLSLEKALRWLLSVLIAIILVIAAIEDHITIRGLLKETLFWLTIGHLSMLGTCFLSSTKKKPEEIVTVV